LPPRQHVEIPLKAPPSSRLPDFLLRNPRRSAASGSAYNDRLVASKHDHWWANTWWGKRTAIVNISIAVVLFLFMLWKALIP
jgi:hypothetical protein